MVEEPSFRRIVVALDGSRNAERILPVVIPLLEKVRGSVLLTQVLAADASGPVAAARSYLRVMGRRLERKGIEVEIDTPRGDPALEILRSASDFRANLIALTTHGRGALARWILGSVAQKVVRGARYPVLLAKGVGKPPERVRTLLVPMDGSPRGEGGLPFALSLAHAFGAEILLLHVSPSKGIEARDSKFRRWLKLERERVEARFDFIRRTHPELAVRTALDEGDPATEIIRRSERHRGALVVMSSHGRTGIRRFVFGSVTEKVFPSLKVPLLIVRSF